MSIIVTEAISRRDMAPEIVAAIAAVSLPQVQSIIRQLSKYNLAVAVPHMHLPEQDFAALPSDFVQVEKQCVVSWIPRDQVEADSEMIPVAWRWDDHRVKANAVCDKFCSPHDQGHAKYHSKR